MQSYGLNTKPYGFEACKCLCDGLSHLCAVLVQALTLYTPDIGRNVWDEATYTPATPKTRSTTTTSWLYAIGRPERSRILSCRVQEILEDGVTCREYSQVQRAYLLGSKRKIGTQKHTSGVHHMCWENVTKEIVSGRGTDESQHYMRAMIDKTIRTHQNAHAIPRGTSTCQTPPVLTSHYGAQTHSHHQTFIPRLSTIPLI
jgi:hypothetical protein